MHRYVKQLFANSALFSSQIASVKFITLTYCMMDIIPLVTKLSLFFQKEDLDIALVKVNRYNYSDLFLFLFFFFFFIFLSIGLYHSHSRLHCFLFQVNVDNCVKEIETLMTTPGANEQALKALMTIAGNSWKFLNHEITGCPEIQISSPRQLFLEKLLANFNERLVLTVIL